MVWVAALPSATSLLLSTLLVVTPAAHGPGADAHGARASEAGESGDAPTSDGGSANDEDEAWAAAEALFREGSAHFAASDYKSAIADFTEALDIVNRHDFFDPAVRRALLINLARVHRRAFLIDDDLTHLTTAADIYRRIASMAPGSEDAQEAMRELPPLEAQIVDLRGQRRSRDAGQEPEAAETQEPESDPSVPAPNTGVKMAAQGPPPQPLQPIKTDGANIKKLKAAAWSLGGVGVLGLGSVVTGMIVGRMAVNHGQDLVEEDPSRPREDFDGVIARGQVGNILAFAGAGLAVAALGSSLILALKARKQRKLAARVGFSPRGRGFAVQGRLRF